MIELETMIQIFETQYITYILKESANKTKSIDLIIKIIIRFGDIISCIAPSLSFFNIW